VLRVVVDTNVLVSGLIMSAGTARHVVNELIAQRFEPILTPDLAFELQNVMSRPKFWARVIDEARLAAILSFVRPGFGVIDALLPVRDPSDVIVVAAAIGEMADLIVTGDRDLLDDGELVQSLRARSIEVITPAELVRRLNAPPPAAR
jgi:uncharacterized protein